MEENIESIKINLYISSFTCQLIFVYILIYEGMGDKIVHSSDVLGGQ